MPPRSEIFGGFVFVNLDPDAAPMEHWYPGVATALAEYLPDPERLRPVRTCEVVERCNGKVSVENQAEDVRLVESAQRGGRRAATTVRLLSSSTRKGE